MPTATTECPRAIPIRKAATCLGSWPSRRPRRARRAYGPTSLRCCTKYNLRNQAGLLWSFRRAQGRTRRAAARARPPASASQCAGAQRREGGVRRRGPGRARGRELAWFVSVRIRMSPAGRSALSALPTMAHRSHDILTCAARAFWSPLW